MAKKLEDKEILDTTINSVLMGASDVNQQRIEEILDEVTCKVVEEKQKGASQVLKIEAEDNSQGKKKKVLTSFHRGQVLLCNLIKYQISHTFQIYEILIEIGISHIIHIHEIGKRAHAINNL